MVVVDALPVLIGRDVEQLVRPPADPPTDALLPRNIEDELPKVVHGVDALIPEAPVRVQRLIDDRSSPVVEDAHGVTPVVGGGGADPAHV